MQLIRFIILASSLLNACASYAANTYSQNSYTKNTYTVTYVYDGDTVKLQPLDSNASQDAFKLRLTDIDAPERTQAYGLKSRRALMDLCYGKDIIATVIMSGTDKYNRTLGRLQCNNVDASLYLAERGLAWHYAQYSSDVEIYQAAKNARRLTLGLWADDNPTPPWVWRHQSKRDYSKRYH